MNSAHVLFIVLILKCMFNIILSYVDILTDLTSLTHLKCLLLRNPKKEGIFSFIKFHCELFFRFPFSLVPIARAQNLIFKNKRYVILPGGIVASPYRNQHKLP
jgi:hypothetical protein